MDDIQDAEIVEETPVKTEEEEENETPETPLDEEPIPA